MKPYHLVPSVALAILLATGCGKKSSEVAKQLSDLERKANEATERQQQLEQQIEEQKLAAERDAIERERMRIEEARAELELRQDEAAAADAEKLRQREESLASREGKLDLWQSTLEEKQTDLQQRDTELSERDRELAGREAVALDDEEEYDETPVGDYGTFHDSLSPYGSWFDTPDYGYVWQPVVVRDLSWRPYTRGRWVCTNRGWTWISDEPFGWATYHYGRWALCRGYGWIWVPGSEWAPSWVSWRHSGTHIGWAPLPPETLAYRGRRCDSTVDVTFGIGASWFNFVETRYFGNPIHHHCLPYTQNNIYIGETINITNIYVHNRRVICGGPRYWDVQRQTDRKPPFYRIEEDRHGRPGRDPLAMRPMVRGDRLRVAAPNMDAAWNDGLKPAKIKGRIDSIKVERQEEPLPEVADRFRQSREENRGKAERSIAELGGADNFKLRRMEQLETNRRQVETQTRQPAKTRDDREPAPRNQLGKRDDGPKVTPPRDDRKQVLDNADPIRIQRGQAGKPDNLRPLMPPRDDKKPPQDNTDRNRKQPGDVAEQTRQRVETRRDEEQAGQPDKGGRIFPPREETKQNQDNADRLRKQREDAAEQLRQREEAGRKQDNAPRVTPPREDNNRMPDDTARVRKQQEEQADRARQQQEAQQQQREQARQQQMEQARRDQARQQQEESQREQARQQQMEENRRVQARQQQQEENRREQARQQQQEESRREQARQQQQEENRREQSRQQEQQRQKDDDEKRRARNR